MKELRTLISLNLCLAMLLSMLSPMAAFAVDEEMGEEPVVVEQESGEEVGIEPLAEGEREVLDSGTCGESVEWTLYEDGELVISGTGEMENYSINDGEGAPWYKKRSKITSLTIGPEVTSIGEAAFDECNRLLEVTIPGNVTDIGSGAFYCCTGLTAVEICDGVTSIGGSAFDKCSSLATVALPASVTNMEDAVFGACSSLTSIVVDEANEAYCSDENGVLFTEDGTKIVCYPAGKTETEYNIPSGVTCIGDSAFDGCENLTVIGIPDSVTSIERYAFIGCRNLLEMMLPAGVTTIDHPYMVFMGCTGLAAYVVDEENPAYCSDEYGVLFTKDMTELLCYPAGNTRTEYHIADTVTSVGVRAFENCDNLTSIEIPASVTCVDPFAFSRCEKLPAVELLGVGGHLEQGLFYGCSSLSVAVLSNEVTSIGPNVFVECTDLTDIFCGKDKNDISFETVASDNTAIENAYWHTVDTTLEEIVPIKAAECENGTVTIPCGYAAKGETIPVTVEAAPGYELAELTVDHGTAGEGSFTVAGEGEFTEVTVSARFGKSSAQKVWYVGAEDETDAIATLYDGGLLEITGFGWINGFDLGQYEVKELVVGDEICNIPSSLLADCQSLESVQLGKNVTDIGYRAFRNCENLRSIALSKNSLWIGNYAFQNCTNLTYINLSGAEYIGLSAFEGCGSLNIGLYLPNVEEIGASAFEGCGSLSGEPDLPNVEVIGNSAFADCEGLCGSPYLPVVQTIGSSAFRNTGITGFSAKRVLEIGYAAFMDCRELTTVTIPSTLLRLEQDAFRDCVSLSKISWSADQCRSVGDGGAFYNAGSEGSGFSLYVRSANVPAKLFHVSKNDISESGEGAPKLKAVRFYCGDNGKIGSQAFYNCRYLETVEMSGNITAIGEGAFNGCTALHEITLGDRVENIGRKAFFDSGLSKAVIPSFVSSIGEDAFSACDESLTIYGIAGSAAEDYAEGAKIPFVALSLSGTIGETLFWEYDGDNDSLLIYGSGVLNGWEGDAPWANLSDAICTVKVQEGITAVEGAALKDLPNLNDVEYPATLETLSSEALSGSALSGVVYVRFAGEPPQLLDGNGAQTNALCEDDIAIQVQYPYGAAGWDTVSWDNCDFVLYYPQTAVVTIVFSEFNVQRAEAWGIGETVALQSKSISTQIEKAIERYGFGYPLGLKEWNTEADGSGTSYAPDAEFTVTEDLTLYARWEEYPTFTVDGVSYNAFENHDTEGWSYNYAPRNLPVLTIGAPYSGGSITSDIPIRIVFLAPATINGSISLPGNGSYQERIDAHAPLTVHGGSEAAIEGVDILCVYDTAELNSESAPAVRANGAFTVAGNGSKIRITSGGSTAVETPGAMQLQTRGLVEIKATETAVSAGKFTVLNQQKLYDLYLGETAEDPAARYEGGAYLRLEPKTWELKLDANGGAWSDQVESLKTILTRWDLPLLLSALKEQISRVGYILTGWSDAEDTVEFSVNDSVYSASDMTLYAKWEEEGLVINGATYSPNKSSRGTGWTYTPGDDEAAPILALKGYQGGAIRTTAGLTVTFSGENTITAAVGEPAIQAMGDVLLYVYEGATATIRGGSGERAVRSGRNLKVINGGKLEILGGTGGEALHAEMHLYITNNGQMTAAGSGAAHAVKGLIAEFFGSGKTVLTGGAAGYSAADLTMYATLDPMLKVYAGESASTAVRQESYSDWWHHAYVRVQPKTVVVTMYANGGTVNDSAYAVSEFERTASDQVAFGKLEEPVRVGYSFKGWNTAPDGSGTTYADNTTYNIENSVEAVKLYAQWEEFDYEIVGKKPLAISVGYLPEGSRLMLTAYNAAGKMEGVYMGALKDDGNWVFPVNAVPNSAVVKLVICDQNFEPLKKAVVIK